MATKVLLLVDDDPVFCTYVQEALRSLDDVKLHVVGTGKAAVKFLESQRVDALLLDGLLPDMNGFEFLTRADGYLGRTPVLFVSSFWKDFESFKTLTAVFHVAGVLHKPVGQARLLAVVRALLDKGMVAPETSGGSALRPRQVDYR